MRAFNWGLKYYKKRIPLAIFCQVISELAILIVLVLPLLSQLIIDGVINYTGQEVSANFLFKFLLNGKYGQLGTLDFFISVATLFMILVVLRVLINYIRNNLAIRNGLYLEVALRKDTYKKLLRLSNKSLAKYNTGEILTIMDSDINAFKDLYGTGLVGIIDAIFMIVIITIFLWQINVYLLLVPLTLVPILIIILNRYLKMSKEVSTDIRSKTSKMNDVVQETINGIRLVKAYANEAYEEEKFYKCNEDTKNSYFNQIEKQSKFNAMFNGLRQLAYVASVAVCVIFAINESLQIGQLVACTSYVVSLMNVITNLNNGLFNMQQQMVSGNKVKTFMEEEEIPDEIKIDHIENDDIIIKNMYLSIDNKIVLKNINLEIPYGMKLGVMGSTGSGKSAFLKTLSNILPYTAGEITIGGKKISDYNIDELRSQFSYVFQDVFLFSETIEANIAFAVPNASNDKIKEVARLSQADKFITKMPNGYETIVGEKGLGLSGGQKQRISIARALIRNAPILILDDATSALDRETEKELMETIKAKHPNKTMIISAHKVSSVKDCDKIIYIHDGEIVESGTYEELMKLNGMFASIVKIQEEQASDDVDEKINSKAVN